MDSKLNDKLLTAVSSIALTLTVFMMTHLWSRVDSLELRLAQTNKELAEIMLKIENRLTKVETVTEAKHE